MQSTMGLEGRERRPSYDTSKRSALACNRCRGRKTKCKGTPPIQCPACEEAGVECTYTETERRIPVPERCVQLPRYSTNRQFTNGRSILLDLQARARAADQCKSSCSMFLPHAGLRMDANVAATSVLVLTSGSLVF